MAWKLTWEGEVYREADLTLGQIERIEDGTATSWLAIAPLRSAKHARWILAVCMADRLGITDQDALTTTAAVNADAFITAIETEGLEEQMNLPDEFEDGIPKEAGGPSTP